MKNHHHCNLTPLPLIIHTSSTPNSKSHGPPLNKGIKAYRTSLTNRPSSHHHTRHHYNPTEPPSIKKKQNPLNPLLFHKAFTPVIQKNEMKMKIKSLSWAIWVGYSRE
ncbi:hypothetical protein NE237_002474 [Protea cynaroides]|uniref:Uncharacterized protein n=1 Tax=Protea cynaroides TaxID=273540 RepID=A0A9Q0QZ32_9MAGN|nr:hypothetical protein NE237_002474 [Protea cynaroides]